MQENVSSGQQQQRTYYVDDEPQTTTKEELTVQRILEKAGVQAQASNESEAILFELRNGQRIEHKDLNARIRIQADCRFVTRAKDVGGGVKPGTESRPPTSGPTTAPRPTGSSGPTGGFAAKGQPPVQQQKGTQGSPTFGSGVTNPPRSNEPGGKTPGTNPSRPVQPGENRTGAVNEEASKQELRGKKPPEEANQ